MGGKPKPEAGSAALRFFEKIREGAFSLRLFLLT